jgi:hypothetical protein
MKQILLLFLIIPLAPTTYAQKYNLDKSLVTFFSAAVLEDIKAENTKTISLFNAGTGEIAFVVPIDEFQFNKSLMHDHFNEKYMETERYPQGRFVGRITNYNNQDVNEQQVVANGKLTIHGVTHDVEIPGTLVKTASQVIMKSKFIVKLADYNIKIPSILWQNIAEQVTITIDLTYKPH